MNTAIKSKARQDFLRHWVGYINKERDDGLEFVAILMMENELYSSKGDIRRVKQGILSILAGFDGMRTGSAWDDWQRINGWDVWKPHSLI